MVPRILKSLVLSFLYARSLPGSVCTCFASMFSKLLAMELSANRPSSDSLQMSESMLRMCLPPSNRESMVMSLGLNDSSPMLMLMSLAVMLPVASLMPVPVMSALTVMVVVRVGTPLPVSPNLLGEKSRTDAVSDSSR